MLHHEAVVAEARLGVRLAAALVGLVDRLQQLHVVRLAVELPVLLQDEEYARGLLADEVDDRSGGQENDNGDSQATGIEWLTGCRGRLSSASSGLRIRTDAARDRTRTH